MTESWTAGFKAALLTYVQYYKSDAVEVISWDEEVDAYAGQTGCDTCGWGADEPYTLTINYVATDGLAKSHITNDTFGSILTNLVD